MKHHGTSAVAPVGPKSIMTAMVIAFLSYLCFANTSFANPPLLAGVWTDITPKNMPILPSATTMPRTFMQGMAIDPNNPSIIYFCASGSGDGYERSAGLWKTTDAGSTWTRRGHITSGIRCGDTIDEAIHVRVDPANSQHIYCVDGVRGCTMGFWVSNDGGDNFFAPTGYETWRNDIGTGDCYDVAVDPTDFNHVLVSFHSGWKNTDAGVAESKDGGNTWISHEVPGAGGAGMSVWFLYRPERGIGSSRTWLLGTQNAGYWRTGDAGATWSNVSANPIAHGGGQIYCGKNNWIYATTAANVMRSSDNGVTWASIPSSPQWNNGIGGDGTRLYTSAASGPMMTSLESDGLTWTTYTPTVQLVQCPFEMVFDSVNNIMYNSSWGAGIWACKVNVTKPTVRLAGAPVSVTYVRGQAMSPQSRVVAAVNPYYRQGFHLSGPVTVTNKRSWLRLSVNAANADSQLITNTIDPSALPDAETTYYDTVNVHAANADVVDQTFIVSLWMRNQAIFSSITLAPQPVSIVNGQSQQFTASARDQYDIPLTIQPQFTWNAEGGTVSSNGLYTNGGCQGSFGITAMSAGITGTASITVAELNASQAATVTVSSGIQASAVKDGVVSGHPADGTKEWISGGEKAGAWVQLSWTNAIAIDSVALWDRPNGDDQILSGTLTFSDGSAITVGTLPNDAKTAWTQKFTRRSVTWVKLTVNTVSSSTVNVGLAEFGAFNSQSCSTNDVFQINSIPISHPLLSVTVKGLFVNVPHAIPWTLGIFALDGSKVMRMSGKGSALVSTNKICKASGFVTAILRNGNSESTCRILIK